MSSRDGVFKDKDWFIREIATECDVTLGDARMFINGLERVFEKVIDEEIPLDVRGLFHLEVKEIKYEKGVRPGKSKLPFDKNGYHPPSKKVIFRISKNLRNRLRPLKQK